MQRSFQTGFDKLLLGFVFFFVGGLFGSIFNQFIIEAFIKTIGWFYIITGFSRCKKRFGCSIYSRQYLNIVRIYIIMSIVMIVRGYLIDYPYQFFSLRGVINYHFFNTTYILPYLMPLVLCIPWDCVKFDKLVRYGQWVAIIGLILFVINAQEIVSASVTSALGDDREAFYGRQFAVYSSFAFATLCAKYIRKRTWLINVLGLVVATVVLMISARRGASLIHAVLLFFCFYYYLKTRKGERRIIDTIIVLVIIAVGVVIVAKSSAFQFIFLRGFEDSRSYVDQALLSQMDNWQMVFGKGLNGRYYCPLNLDDDYLDGWRYLSETGFLNLVLKGGFSYAITYVVMLFIPGFLGMAKSKNMLCRVGGFYIMLSLADLYPFGMLTFNVQFLVIWLLISLCMNPLVRNMSDEDIKNQFFSR